MVAQPSTGFLNVRYQPDGSPTEDTEDCLGRITVGLTRSFFFLAGALCLSAGHHLRLTRGPAGNRTTTGSLSASPRTTPYQLSHEDT